MGYFGHEYAAQCALPMLLFHSMPKDDTFACSVLAFHNYYQMKEKNVKNEED